jgi:hypothetical protein
MCLSNMNLVDITIKWRLAGWIPPSEQTEYQRKWKTVREGK